MDNKQEQLRARAYGIWQAEGEPHGRDREHWEMAERELATPEGDESQGEKPEAAAPVTPPEKKAAPASKNDGGSIGATKSKPRKPRTARPA